MQKHAARPSKSGGKIEAAEIPPLEWAVAAVGLVLVLGTAVFLASQGYANRSSPPDISLRSESVVQLRNGYLMNVEALNVGGSTAADVKVTGALANASGVAETSEMTFRYLPPNSARTGGLFFTKDPRQFKLTLRPTGYEAP